MFNAVANWFLVKKKKTEESEENLMPPATCLGGTMEVSSLQAQLPH